MNAGIFAKLLVVAGICAAAGFSAEPIDFVRSQRNNSFVTQQGSALEHGAKSIAAGSTKATPPVPVPGHAAPSAEQVAVYKAFMIYFADRSLFAQVSDLTYAIPLANAHRCLPGVKLEKSDAAPLRAQTLPQGILSDPHKFRLVTIRSDSEHHERLLRLSDIIFDSRHEYAVLNYSYRCGFLCGEGETVVFRKFGQTWKQLRSCAEWIS